VEINDAQMDHPGPAHIADERVSVARSDSEPSVQVVKYDGRLAIVGTVEGLDDGHVDDTESDIEIMDVYRLTVQPEGGTTNGQKLDPFGYEHRRGQHAGGEPIRLNVGHHAPR
jgi:hypothetical protein